MAVIHKVEELEAEVEELKNRLKDLETQMGRIVSHVESETKLMRGDVRRVEIRLFGEKEDDVYGGRIGQLTKNQYRLERLAAYGLGSVATVMTILRLFKII